MSDQLDGFDLTVADGLQLGVLSLFAVIHPA